MTEKLTRKNDKEAKKCSKCGTILSEDALFCPKCGQKVGAGKKVEQDFEKYKPNKERLIRLKQFLQNNFELSYTVYGLVFLFTLFSKWLGVLLFIIATIVLYMKALSHKGKTIKANQQVSDFYRKMTQKFQDGVQEANEVNAKDKHSDETPEDSGAVSKAEKNESNAPTQSAGQKRITHQQYKTYYQKKNYVNKNGSGFSSFLLLMSSLVTLYGVLGAGFISNSNASLYGLVGQTSSYIKMIEGVGRFFGSSSGGGAGFIQSLGYGLVLMPILVIILSCFTRSKILRFLGFVAALLEVGIFGFMMYYVSEKANQFLGSYSGSLLNPNTGIFGMTANIFFIAMLLMVIFAGYRLFQRKR
ncbi:zinc ribbon domain-containing protein [Holzapfeliella sp. JNUCC 72]